MQPSYVSWSRREFLALGALTAMTGCMPSRHTTMPIVDCHIHCFAGTSSAEFPYHDRAPYRPDSAATPQQLLACMDAVGIAYGIVVHPEPYQDDHRYLEYCLQVGNGRLKGTCLFFADDPDAPTKLTALAKRTSLIAARVHAYAPERLPPFGQPSLRALWKAAADNGLMLQLHFEPRYAPGFEALIDEFSSTTVIIDHLGRPLQGTHDEHQQIIRWADKPNTIMKVSAFAEQSSYPHRDIQPAITALTTAYGAERMIYGGGFEKGGTPDGYRTTLTRVRALLSHLNTHDQDLILGGTATRLFSFS